jgi:hypothetical protein
VLERDRGVLGDRDLAVHRDFHPLQDGHGDLDAVVARLGDDVFDLPDEPSRQQAETGRTGGER